MTLLNKITDLILGHKYYTIVTNRICTTNCDLSSLIFPTRNEAEEKFAELALESRSTLPVEIVSFRSRRHYATFSNSNGFPESYCLVKNELPFFANKQWDQECH